MLCHPVCTPVVRVWGILFRKRNSLNNTSVSSSLHSVFVFSIIGCEWWLNGVPSIERCLLRHYIRHSITYKVSTLLHSNLFNVVTASLISILHWNSVHKDGKLFIRIEETWFFYSSQSHNGVYINEIVIILSFYYIYISLYFSLLMCFLVNILLYNTSVNFSQHKFMITVLFKRVSFLVQYFSIHVIR